MDFTSPAASWLLAHALLVLQRSLAVSARKRVLRAHILQVKLNFDSALQSLSEPSTSRIKGANEGSLNNTQMLSGILWASNLVSQKYCMCCT